MSNRNDDPYTPLRDAYQRLKWAYEAAGDLKGALLTWDRIDESDLRGYIEQMFHTVAPDTIDEVGERVLLYQFMEYEAEIELWRAAAQSMTSIHVVTCDIAHELDWPDEESMKGLCLMFDENLQLFKSIIDKIHRTTDVRAMTRQQYRQGGEAVERVYREYLGEFASSRTSEVLPNSSDESSDASIELTEDDSLSADELFELTEWATRNLRQNQKRVVLLVAQNGGYLTFDSVANDSSIQWEKPYDSAASGLRIRLNEKLSLLGYCVHRHDNGFRLAKITTGSSGSDEG